jgi:hypothetical protein
MYLVFIPGAPKKNTRPRGKDGKIHKIKNKIKSPSSLSLGGGKEQPPRETMSEAEIFPRSLSLSLGRKKN